MHPTTGDVLVSLRNCSAVICINYETKDVRWVLQGQPSPSYGTLQAVAIPAATSGTKWLSLAAEPLVEGFQYDGPRAQHDARWLPDGWASSPGRSVVSLYDNQSAGNFGFTSSGAGPYSRGVVYEIDSDAETATHRSSIFSDIGISPYIGSYTLLEDGGDLSHAINFPTEHPQLVEYVGGIDEAKAKTFAMDLVGDVYRIIKVPLSQFRIDNLRATCGVNADTGALPSVGGGGLGGTLLLIHFDGSNGSTTFADSSGSGLSVTASATGNAQISTAQSKFGGASLYTDKSVSGQSGVDVDPFEMGTSWTVEAWIYLNVNSSYIRAVFARRDAYNNGLSVGVSDAGGLLFYNGLLSVVSDSSSVPTGEWAHVAWSMQEGTLRMFLNGTKTFEDAVSYSVDPDFATVGYVPFNDSYTEAFEGYIDEVRVSGTAVYTDDFTPPTVPFTP